MIGKKLGTFLGVFTPNVSMMFGVILFLRLGVITGNAGLWTMLLVILMALSFMLLTCLSISSITSNMDGMGSGVYYIISRALGLKIGGALGIVMYISQLFMISLANNGFSYLFHDLFPQTNIIAIEVILISLLAIVSLYSARLALKIQVVIITIVILSLSSILFGNVGNLEIISEPKPFYQSMNFWYTFSIFYPAIIGIEIGMSMSKSLKTPGRSIFIGNIISLLLVAFIYAFIVIFAWKMIPHANLKSEPLTLAKYSYCEKLVYLGLFATAISASLGTLISAPRILQTMAEDKIMPKIFTKVYGKNSEPRYALLFTAMLAIIVTICTNLEKIIPLLTMNSLITYGMLNFITAISTLIKPASWRPTFKIHYLISFLGVLVALVLMFMINAGWSFISIALLLIFFLILHMKDLNAAFADLTSSVIFFFSRQALYKLSAAKEHVMTWHPILLMLTSSPTQHLRLIKLVHNIAKQNGILIVGAVLTDYNAPPERLMSTRLTVQSFLNKNQVKGLAEIAVAENIQDGFINLIKSYGIGSMQPNTIVTFIDPKIDFIDKTLELLGTCYINRKNLMLFQDGERFKDKISPYEVFIKENQIDIWWDSKAKDSFNFILNLLVALSSSTNWKKATIHLKYLALSANAAQGMRVYLEKFVVLSRLNMQVHVYHTKKDGFTLGDAINRHSKKTVLTFVPLQCISSSEEKGQEYKDYLLSLFKKHHSNRGAIIMCCCLDNTEHQEIYSYPEED